jgi:hypothetical protein
MQVSNKENVKSKGEGKCRRSVIKGNKAYRVYRGRAEESETRQ